MSCGDRIAAYCLEHFNGLPKNGKPLIEREWTVLSCIVLENKSTDKLNIVSLGTGTKCIPAQRMSNAGDQLNDSHAEVLARRSLLRYFYSEILKISDDKKAESSIFMLDKPNCKFKLKSAYAFHFFSTHSPCGDASIFDNTDKNDYDNEIPTKKPRIDNLTNEEVKIFGKDQSTTSTVNSNLTLRMPTKTDEISSLTSNASSFTGAKLIRNDSSGDLMAQHIGEIRTKPGRGCRSLSMSCSDKLARWNCVGVQGALLSILLEAPVHLSSYTFGGGSDFNLEALERAIWKRWQMKSAPDSTIRDINLANVIMQRPIINLVSATICEFPFRQTKTTSCDPSTATLDARNPSPTSIIWCRADERPALEVAIEGRKHGVTKKNLEKPCGRLRISKVELFGQFHAVLKQYPDIKDHVCAKVGEHIDNLSYGRVKELAVEYNNQWCTFKKRYFLQWTTKPKSLLNFKLPSLER